PTAGRLMRRLAEVDPRCAREIDTLLEDFRHRRIAGVRLRVLATSSDELVRKVGRNLLALGLSEDAAVLIREIRGPMKASRDVAFVCYEPLKAHPQYDAAVLLAGLLLRGRDLLRLRTDRP